MLHALHIQYIGWDVMACIHNVTDAHLGVQMCNATTLVRDILYMLCVRACDYVTCTAHTVYPSIGHGGNKPELLQRAYFQPAGPLNVGYERR